ncbi:MAG: hypothetical protein R3A52_17295 [Polyangiales bacterium]
MERAANESLDWARDPRNNAPSTPRSRARRPRREKTSRRLARGTSPASTKAARRLADQREARDRRAAEASLRQAAEEARRNGSNALARALDDEADLLHRRGQAKRLTREIAAALRGTQGAQRAAAEHLPAQRRPRPLALDEGPPSSTASSARRATTSRIGPRA